MKLRKLWIEGYNCGIDAGRKQERDRMEKKKRKRRKAEAKQLHTFLEHFAQDGYVQPNAQPVITLSGPLIIIRKNEPSAANLHKRTVKTFNRRKKALTDREKKKEYRQPKAKRLYQEEIAKAEGEKTK